MKIINDNGETFGVICGFRYETDIIVTGGYAVLTFHTDSEVQDKGFNISFIVVPKPSEYSQNNIIRYRQCRFNEDLFQNSHECRSLKLHTYKIKTKALSF